VFPSSSIFFSCSLPFKNQHLAHMTLPLLILPRWQIQAPSTTTKQLILLRGSALASNQFNSTLQLQQFVTNKNNRINSSHQKKEREWVMNTPNSPPQNKNHHHQKYWKDSVLYMSLEGEEGRWISAYEKQLPIMFLTDLTVLSDKGGLCHVRK
jgi:hypothetical protein